MFYLGFGKVSFLGIWRLSMGCLDEGHLDIELENEVSIGFAELGLEEETNAAAIEDAVKVLLLGLGEDINRDGLRKTPLRVAKALREGTKGELLVFLFNYKLLVIVYYKCRSEFSLNSNLWLYIKGVVRKIFTSRLSYSL